MNVNATKLPESMAVLEFNTGIQAGTCGQAVVVMSKMAEVIEAAVVGEVSEGALPSIAIYAAHTDDEEVNGEKEDRRFTVREPGEHFQPFEMGQYVGLVTHHGRTFFIYETTQSLLNGIRKEIEERNRFASAMGAVIAGIGRG